MAGTPRYHELRMRWAQLAQEAGESPDVWMFGMVEDGRSISWIAREVFQCSREYVYRLMRECPNWEKRYRDAKKLTAVLRVDQADEIMEDLTRPLAEGEMRIIAPGQVSAAEAQARHHLRMAEIFERGTVEPARGAAVQLNLSVGSLHLDALRQAGSVGAQKLVEAELVQALPSGDPEPTP